MTMPHLMKEIVLTRGANLVQELIELAKEHNIYQIDRRYLVGLKEELLLALDRQINKSNTTATKYTNITI